MTNPTTDLAARFEAKREDAIEAAARAYYDGMIGRPEDQWPHHDGWAGKSETFKAKVRVHMARALEAAAEARDMARAGAAGGAGERLGFDAARAEYARWATGGDTSRRAGERNWTCRQNDNGTWAITTYHQHYNEADQARHEQALAAAIQAAAPPPPAQQGSSSPPLTAERVDWTCAARRQGTAGGNDPADCDWPVCGCDPYADKVIASLQEAGHLVPASLPGGTGSAEEGTGPGFDDWCFDMDAAPKNGRPVLLTVPSSYKGRAPHVGEAFHHPEVQDGSWWWAGTSHLDHPGISINEGNEAPIAWRYLPKPAALATLHASQDQAGEVR